MDGRLDIEPNIAAPDDFYEKLIDMHRDLTESESRMVNARLILLLANHIGDIGVLEQAMTRARAVVGKPRPQQNAEPILGERR